MRRRDDGSYIYSPSDLNLFFESPFASWMERFQAESAAASGVKASRGEKDAQAQFIAERGLAHEKAYLDSLIAAGRDVCVIDPDADPLTATERAMRDGREIIFQGALRRTDDGILFQGLSDFLFRTDEPSPRLRWTYEVADTKLARKPKPYFLLQLCAYAEMLEAIQGCRPAHVVVITGDNTERRFRTDDYYFYFLAVKRAFLEQQRTFDPKRRPIPEYGAEHRQWNERAKEILEELDHPCRVAGITAQQTKRLSEHGIDTLTALAKSKVKAVPRVDATIFDRLRHQAKLQLRAKTESTVPFDLLPHTPGLGFARLPPASKLDVFFDMEGFPLLEGGGNLEYLFGATHLVKGVPVFQDFWAHNTAEEQRAFESFVDWIFARFKKDPAMHVYHYAPYEPSALKRLMGKYGTREDEVDTMLRAGVFVDLYQIVRQAVRVGEPRYSLKNIERLYREKREGSVGTAGESVVEFARWLETPDGASWKESKILAGIRDYNRDDCESTYGLVEWLRPQQEKSGIAYEPIELDEDEELTDKQAAARDARDNADALVARLLAKIPHGEAGRVHELVAHLVGFHRREDKPVWWALYEHLGMDEADLIADMTCLAALERTKTPPVTEKRSQIFEYRFDPNQDTKMHAGSKCYVVPSPEAGKKFGLTIHTLDGAAGLVTFKTTKTLPNRFSLIPNDYVDPSPIPESIYRIAERYEKTKKLSPALTALLHREAPRIRGRASGAPILDENEDILEGAKRAVAALDGSTLAIQGPPGAGKTYVAARVILHLIDAGKRVGISSHSHKVIEHLMAEVMKAAKEQKVNVPALKIGGDDDGALFTDPNVTHGSAKDLDYDDHKTPKLIGGTAWFFSAPEQAGKFDTLFVDEAGQVSLANLVGMSPSATNLVLVGDQMQLGQPIKGSHPGESGKSALEYLLQDRATIPEDKGIFLAKTYRLHPGVCEFISGAIYEGRLKHESRTEHRSIVGEQPGVRFIAVDHEGNTQESEEEAERIEQLVEDLLKRKFIEKKDAAPRKLTREEILLVAPYNAQVRRLQKFHPKHRTGSVDLFQGQEAPVVILSMCTSAGETSPRGIEFLFSPNRLNVAISRAQCLAVVVGNPSLTRTRVTNVEQMRLVNLFCRAVGTN